MACSDVLILYLLHSFDLNYLFQELNSLMGIQSCSLLYSYYIILLTLINEFMNFLDDPNSNICILNRLPPMKHPKNHLYTHITLLY